MMEEVEIQRERGSDASERGGRRQPKPLCSLCVGDLPDPLRAPSSDVSRAEVLRCLAPTSVPRSECSLSWMNPSRNEARYTSRGR